MDQVIGRIREGFTFIIELKTLQIHADRAVALPDEKLSWNYKYFTCTLQGHFQHLVGESMQLGF